MDVKRATALLRKAERAAYGPRGCEIAWKRAEEEKSEGRPGSREVVYRGAACNCQARLIYDKNYVVALVLKSAC